MSTPNRRSDHSEQDQIQGAAQRLLHEGVPLNEAKFRTEDTEAFREKVRKTGQSIFGTSEKAVSAEAAEIKRELTDAQKLNLFASLGSRFSKQPDHYKRPKGVDFKKVKAALEADPVKMWSLAQMENTGGAPDIIAIEGDEFIFADCSAESPDGRRNCVFDKEAETVHPFVVENFNGNAVDMAKSFGVDIMNDSTYRKVLQKIGRFDLNNTSSWVLKSDPAKQARIRNSRFGGNALRGTRFNSGVIEVRQDLPFLHNDNRAWRGVLRVKMV